MAVQTFEQSINPDHVRYLIERKISSGFKKEDFKPFLSLTDNKKEYLQKFYQLFQEFSIMNPTGEIYISEANEYYWRSFASMFDEKTLIYDSVDAFTTIEEVNEVYFLKNNNLVEFFILVDKDKYDRSLMKRLFTIEKQVSNMWDESHVEVHYAPSKFLDRTLLKSYTFLYSRDKNGFT